LLLFLVVGGYFGWEFWKGEAVVDVQPEPAEFSNVQEDDNESWLESFSWFGLKPTGENSTQESNLEIQYEDSDTPIVQQEVLAAEQPPMATEISNAESKEVKAIPAENKPSLEVALEEPSGTNSDISQTATSTPESEIVKSTQTEQITEPQPEPANQVDNDNLQDTQSSELELQVNFQSTRLIERQQAASKQKRIHFSFSKDSWVSVKDATDKSLVYDLMRAGEKLELKGVAPIRVFLGDATGVSLLVDEETFDMSRFINRKNIAKFNVN